MQALEIQGIKMQALLIAMHLFIFSICGIQHALCFKNYCHYSASIGNTHHTRLTPVWLQRPL